MVLSLAHHRFPPHGTLEAPLPPVRGFLFACPGAAVSLSAGVGCETPLRHLVRSGCEG